MTDSIIQTAHALLQKQETFVIASIIHSEGSAPRTAGSRMIISRDGKGVGTIGGGLLEAKVMEKARMIIDLQASPEFITFDLTHEDTTAMDMICGGRVTVLADPIEPSPENKRIFDQWMTLLKKGEKGFFLTVVFGSEQKIERIAHAVIDAHDTVHGTLPLDAETLAQIKGQMLYSRFHCLHTSDAMVMVEPACPPHTVYFFGAGHVARPTVHLAAMTGFRTVVLDDRADFANQTRFPEADAIHVLENFEKALRPLSIDSNAFIVIFTRGHLYDRTVLEQALRTPASYIGMIGSRKKRNAIYAALMNSGFHKQDIDRVHSPIGLSIGAQTPEEIAVSIAAELIEHRAQVIKNESV